MRNNWNPKTITVKELEEKMKNNEIAVPTYQRGVVWSDKMQKDLIDSIKNGYPFGALIMYNYNKPDKPLLLIDGLQRSTALFKFVNNPSEYFEEIDISETTIEELAKTLGFKEVTETEKKELKRKLVEWIKKLKGSEAIQNMQLYDCASFIAKNFPQPTKDPNNFDFLTNIKNIVEPTFNEYKEICNNIINRDVPYIEITGDPDCLATIFFRINDKGIKLSKENKFAATWTNRSIKITNSKLNDFIKIVADRYDSIQSEGTKIFGYNHQEFIDEKELDVFELCHAFGKYIKREHPELFGKINNINQSEAVGFTLLNACLLGYKENLPNMNNLLFERFKMDEDINTFIIKVLECVDYVETILAPYIKFKSNKRIGGKKLHTDFQIVSIIASIFRMKHIEEFEPGKYKFNLSTQNSKWNSYDVLIKKNLIKRYISDTLNNVWSGHGDNTLDNIIHDNNYDYYTREISSDNLKATMYNWYTMHKTNHKQLLEEEVKAPSDADKLLMNIIYSESFTAKMQLSEDKFDIEHLFPKKLAEKMLKRFNGSLKLSLSSIGNLCLLPETTNRKKKEKIIYEDKEYTDKLGKKITIKELEENYTFTKEKDMLWAKNHNIKKDELEEKYNKFIDDRFDIIADKVIEVLYPDEKKSK